MKKSKVKAKTPELEIWYGGGECWLRVFDKGEQVIDKKLSKLRTKNLIKGLTLALDSNFLSDD